MTLQDPQADIDQIRLYDYDVPLMARIEGNRRSQTNKQTISESQAADGKIVGSCIQLR